VAGSGIGRTRKTPVESHLVEVLGPRFSVRLNWDWSPLEPTRKK
jgi:hypothetical protein